MRSKCVLNKMNKNTTLYPRKQTQKFKKKKKKSKSHSNPDLNSHASCSLLLFSLKVSHLLSKSHRQRKSYAKRDWERFLNCRTARTEAITKKNESDECHQRPRSDLLRHKTLQPAPSKHQTLNLHKHTANTEQPTSTSLIPSPTS